ncbi:MAG: proline iminopeptidase-family hydrolase [Chlorobi bacterium]|nr:proline iminopeptidase-family hydrolase [Chlorobiota bacterium]
MQSCSSDSGLKPGEGYIDVEGGKVWYKIEGKGNKTPVLILHGGPGATSYYLKPLAALSSDRPVIFFDQLGCGRSTLKMDTSQMNIKFYVDEVEQVKSKLGLKEFYLYGQSWGTVLAAEYYFAHPEGVKALIFASPALSGKLWIRDAKLLLKQLPDSLQQIILKHEKDKTFDSPEYKEALTVYYQKHIARKLPWSPDIDSTFKYLGEEVYVHMNGPSEFTFTGTLQYYDALPELPDIKVPTLFICGEYDEARPETVEYYASLVPGSEFAVINDAAHMTMQDNPEEDIKTIRNFINKIEK